MSGVNLVQIKVIGAQKRLICAPIAIFVQLVRKTALLAHGFHSRPVNSTGSLYDANPQMPGTPDTKPAYDDEEM